ncbi:hypothetical protein BDV18DRAFT_155954 [Aspergillus unguis]
MFPVQRSMRGLHSDYLTFLPLFLSPPNTGTIFQMSGAKSIILRVQESEMNYQEPNEFVDFYFTKFPSDAVSDPARHYIHYQPPRDIPQENAKIHIVIDLETPEFSGTLDQDFPHEIYAVRRGASQLEMYAYPESVKRNLIEKIREYSDNFYPWGRSRGREGKST